MIHSKGFDKSHLAERWLEKKKKRTLESVIRIISYWEYIRKMSLKDQLSYHGRNC